MSVLVASRFFALLALATNVFVVLAAVAWVGGRRSPALAGLRDRMTGGSARSVIGLALAIATVSTLGSLYYSDIVGFPPCILCWYQRIAMYPLVVVLGVAVARSDVEVRRYVLPIVAIGAAIAAYHYALEWSPALDVGMCATDVPCSVAWFRIFGFVSLPYMALSGFLAIGVLVGLVAPASHNDLATKEPHHG